MHWVILDHDTLGALVVGFGLHFIRFISLLLSLLSLLSQ